MNLEILSGLWILVKTHVLQTTIGCLTCRFYNPSNQSNNLLDVLKTEYPDARDINQVTQALSPLQAYGITGGRDLRKLRAQGC